MDTYRYDAKSKSSNANADDYFEIGFISDFEFNATYVKEKFLYNMPVDLYFNINKAPNLYFGFSLCPLISFSTDLNKQIAAGFLGPSLGFKASDGSFGQIKFLWKSNDSDGLLEGTNTKFSI